MADRESLWAPGFTEYLLAGVAGLTLLGIVAAFAFYLVPPRHLQLAELQPAYRVAAQAEFPVGASRTINWGDRVILVVRTGAGAYAAVQGTAPTDGCLLRWDATSLRVLSPCTYLVYDLRGNVVRGLTTVPLLRFPVFVRDDVVYVAHS